MERIRSVRHLGPGQCVSGENPLFALGSIGHFARRHTELWPEWVRSAVVAHTLVPMVTLVVAVVFILLALSPLVRLPPLRALSLQDYWLARLVAIILGRDRTLLLWRARIAVVGIGTLVGRERRRPGVAYSGPSDPNHHAFASIPGPNDRPTAVVHRLSSRESTRERDGSSVPAPAAQTRARRRVKHIPRGRHTSYSPTNRRPGTRSTVRHKRSNSPQRADRSRPACPAPEPVPATTAC